MLAKTKNYRPADKEPFMNERQREYFRQKSVRRLAALVSSSFSSA